MMYKNSIKPVSHRLEKCHLSLQYTGSNIYEYNEPLINVFSIGQELNLRQNINVDNFPIISIMM